MAPLLTPAPVCPMKPPANLSSDISSLTFHKRALGDAMFSGIRTSLQPYRPAIMRGMITVTEPQVWTMIGLMAGVFFGTMTLISTMFTRVVRSEIGGLRGEMNAGIGGLRGEMNGRFSAVDARFDAVEIRFNGVDARIDNLDRDVQFLMHREINRDN